MKKLPIGMQTFSKIINGGFVYADKTRYIYNLLQNTKCNFLSRPRRFGKSLLLDTIACVFEGDKELFHGLWIYDSDYAFEKYPVIRLDLLRTATKNADIFEQSLMEVLRGYYKVAVAVAGRGEVRVLCERIGEG